MTEELSDDRQDSPWELTRLNPDEYDEWIIEVGSGNTLLGFEDWLSAKFNEPTEAHHIYHLGIATTAGRSRAACGVTYMHPGITFTMKPDQVTCLRCRGTRRFHVHERTTTTEGARP